MGSGLTSDAHSECVPVAVVVQGKSTDDFHSADPTRAVVLSAYGCLITLSESVRLGEGHLAECRNRETGLPSRVPR